jgi:hypothetical protein
LHFVASVWLGTPTGRSLVLIRRRHTCCRYCVQHPASRSSLQHRVLSLGFEGCSSGAKGRRRGKDKSGGHLRP